MSEPPVRSARRRWAAVLAATLPLLLTACVSRTPAAEGRLDGSPLAAGLDWPARPDPTPLVLAVGEKYVTLIDHGRRGMGRLYEFEIQVVEEPVDFTVMLAYETTGEIAQVMGTSLTPPKASETDQLDGRGLVGFFTSWHAGQGPDDAPPRNDQTLLYATIPHEAKGSVLFMSSLSGMTSGERALIIELVERDWCVLWTSASLAGMQGRTFPHEREPSRSSFEQIADTFADLVDQNLAERAYAMQALIDVVHEQQPALRSRPVVAVGCSAGAIGLSTMAARLDDSIDAAVFVAGGANVFRITTQSTLLGDRFVFTFDDRPATPEEMRTLDDFTLVRAKLDPYYTARVLQHTPVLMLHAPYDSIVPAAQGDLLYEQLGRPERWTYYPCGHIGLFAWLPTQTNAIVDWIEEAVGERATPAVANAGSP